MVLSPAEKQRRYRERLKAADQTNPDAIERELLQEVEREMSYQERIALADRLADRAMDFQRRAIRLSRMATKLRTGEDDPCNGSSISGSESTTVMDHRTFPIQEANRRLIPSRTRSGAMPLVHQILRP